MSLYGYKRATTPNIDKFFKNSFIFKNAYAPASLTHTDSISLFFSLAPNTHRAFRRSRIQRTEEFLKNYKSLATLLNEKGYVTSAFVSDEDYEYGWGIGKTFQSFFDRSSYSDYGIFFKPQTYSVGTKQLVPVANKWLEKNKDKKFFLFLQGYDMHCPYGPNSEFSNLFQSPHSSSIPFETECFMNIDEFKKRSVNGKNLTTLQSFFAYRDKSSKEYSFTDDDLSYLVSRYDAELRKADMYLGVLFEQISKLNLTKNTLIVFMADHGDNLGENNFFMKSSPTLKGNLHNANLNFPLVIKIPGKKSSNKMQEQIVQTIDIAPTILDILEIPTFNKMQGKSLKPSLGNSTEVNDYAYGFSMRFNLAKYREHATSYNELEYVQNHQWKLGRSRNYNLPDKKFKKEEYVLYNLVTDPDEKNNLISKNIIEKEKLLNVLSERNKFYTRDQRK
jgi:arylsulfatase A-like enzyme